MVELVGTTCRCEPAVDVVINGNVVNTYINRTELGMLSFMLWVADHNGYVFDHLNEQTMVCR